MKDGPNIVDVLFLIIACLIWAIWGHWKRLIYLVVIGFGIWFLLSGCSTNVRTDAIWGGSLRSNHVNQCNPTCANQENGGQGFIVTAKGTDKYFNVGAGRINFTNSFGDPGRVDILQLAKYDYEWKAVNAGIACWRMWIYGYYNSEGEKIVHDITWIVPELSLNPLFMITENFWVTGSYVNFVSVTITFVRVGWRWNFN